MKTLFLLICLTTTNAFASPQSNLTVDFVSLDNLADRYYQDAKRIEVYYPKQFERLEMDYHVSAKKYLSEYKKAKSPEQKIHIFARFYNSFNNAHHRPLDVKGLLKYEPLETLTLPVKIFGQGLKLSEAKFYISELSTTLKESNIQVGDEIISYNGMSIKTYVLATRDEVSSESPEDHINRAADAMTAQKRCRWGKLVCWKSGNKTIIEVKSKADNQLYKVELAWNQLEKDSFSQPNSKPVFPSIYKDWTFKSNKKDLYAADFDSLPDPNVGFMGSLNHAGKHWLIIKIFLFRDANFVQTVIQEARKSEYEGVILDLGDNGGGDDSAMTFLAGIFGTKFNLETSAIRITKEFRDLDILKEATFSSKKAGYLFPFVIEKNLNKMSPFMPFACLDLKCPMKTEFSNYLNYYEKPSLITAMPIKKMALITGRNTASKADSIAALFRATKIGPIVGTPAVSSSGTYYYRKDYVVPIGKNAITLSVTFTPDLSLGGDCEEVQANPPVPDILVERTFENKNYYDTLTWIKAAQALQLWDKTSNVGITCLPQKAKEKLDQFGLIGF